MMSFRRFAELANCQDWVREPRGMDDQEQDLW
jgi:hypothetical protein